MKTKTYTSAEHGGAVVRLKLAEKETPGERAACVELEYVPDCNGVAKWWFEWNHAAAMKFDAVCYRLESNGYLLVVPGEVYIRD